MAINPKNLPIIDDISHYISMNKDGSISFTGETLTILIPRRFHQYGYLDIGESVSALGVMHFTIDEKYQVGVNILATIVIEPSDISSITIDGVEYTSLHLVKGEKIMRSSTLVQDSGVIYALWVELVNGGRLPFWMNYENTLSMFEHAREFTGSGIGVSRSVFEGIIAHLSRTEKDISKQYRYSDMKEPFQFVALSSISNATTSTLAKLAGNYFRNEGLNSALTYQIEENSPFSQILRGLPENIREQ